MRLLREREQEARGSTGVVERLAALERYRTELLRRLGSDQGVTPPRRREAGDPAEPAPSGGAPGLMELRY